MVVDPQVLHVSASVARWSWLGVLFFSGVFLIGAVPTRVRRLLLFGTVAVLIAGTASSLTSTALIWNGIECCDAYAWLLPWFCIPPGLGC